MNAVVHAAFAAGIPVVTPNNRLARAVVAAYDHAQRAAGNVAWPSARALPWGAFVATLWQDAVAQGVATPPFVVLDDDQAQVLWERAVDDDAALLDRRGAAALAAAAWVRFHAYARTGEHVAALPTRGDDQAAFVRWARRYERARDALPARDAATLPGALIDACRDNTWLRGRAACCAGFVDMTPLQRRVLEALVQAGMDVREAAGPATGDPASPVPRRAAFVDARTELRAALTWARDVVLAQPGATVALTVPDLAARRDEVIACADEVLCPQRFLPGGLALPRSWNMSLGTPLAGDPLVVPVLDLLALMTDGLPLPRAAALLCTPFLVGGTQAAARRAGAERAWRGDNVHTVTVRRLQATLGADDPLTGALDRMRALLPRDVRQAPAAWARALSDALGAAGWPGPAPLDSQAYQTCEAFEALLRRLATLGVVQSHGSLTEAVGMLRALAQRALFQPERPRAPVQVLGVLEAAGLTFDALWMTGMGADAWPLPTALDPLLPPAWQRARGDPASAPALALARAERITAQLVASAPQVVASHATGDTEPALPVSALCAWPLDATLAPAGASWFQRVAARAPVLESLPDTTLPALPAYSRARGGVRVVALQSDCPFRAAATLRLDAQPWPGVAWGLSPLERGSVLHAALKHFWDATGDHATLVALLADPPALAARIDAAVRHAHATVPATRWDELPPAVARADRQRLVSLIDRWLRTVEAARPPFAVVQTELARVLKLGTLELALTIDRLDRVGAASDAVPAADDVTTVEDDAPLAIIDYKSNVTVSPRYWLLARPLAPQVGLYALATRAADATARVGALAYAEVKPGKLAMRGIADASVAWKGLKPATDVGAGTFASVHDALDDVAKRYAALATEHQQGAAAVAPRGIKRPCKQCEFKPLCRIGSAVPDDDDDADDEADA
ncbi:MAG: PD-(D/E)XK nuclease family protein [Proteobacteria bacterium]|nr:PD-(D/E)XK nuclease family protein [Pseudomonadota bacterium]